MIRALLLAAVLGLASLPSRAGLFDDDEARARVAKLRTDFDDLAKRADLATKNQIDFANQAEMLKSDLAKLRGQIEVITYELEAAQKRQKDFYIDLDTRLRKLEGGTTDAQAEAKTDAPKVDTAGETRDYEAALTAFKGAKYKDSLAGFLAFIKNYKTSTLLPSAHYWAASSFYQLRDYGHAAELFGFLATTWPSDSKAPDALLAQANAQIEGNDAKSGRKTLELLVAKYPASSAATSANARLKSLPPLKKK